MEISETQLQEKIKNSDYLYIDSINDKLIEQIKSITNYEVEVYHLYKIEDDMNLSIVYWLGEIWKYYRLIVYMDLEVQVK